MISTRWIVVLLGVVCGLALAPAMGQIPGATEGQAGAAREAAATPGGGSDNTGPALAHPETIGVQTPGTGAATGPYPGQEAESSAAPAAAPSPAPRPARPGTPHGGSASAQDQDYRDTVRSEAALTHADTQRPEAPARPQPRSRIDRIRGIVSEAIEESAPPARDQEEAVGRPRETDRRKQVIEAVSSTPEPELIRADPYVSTLREEGSRTRVLDVEAAKRPAIRETSRTALRPQPALSAGGHGAGGAADTYTIREGDSLWRIAQRLYGDGFRYLEIYEANQDTIGNEDLLVVGQVLRLPGSTGMQQRVP